LIQEEISIEVKRRAHVYCNGKLSKRTKFIWIVAHGYGQTASRILGKFKEFNTEKHLVICPEGLSLFYWGGVTGSHAASWMTSKNRLDEIEDFCDYLDEVYNKFILHDMDETIILMGFSQGATTLYRWVQSRKKKFDYFINWAGWFPEDIEMKEVEGLFKDKHFLVYGEKDEYLSEQRIEQMKYILNREGFSPEIISFDGNHEVSQEVLEEIANKKLL
jgi:predicted esterase